MENESAKVLDKKPDEKMEGPPSTARMNSSETAKIESKESPEQKAKNLKELQNVITEMGEVVGARGEKYSADVINKRLEELCMNIKETRTKTGRQWWNENAVRNMATTMYGITNGADKDGAKIRDAIIKLLRPENADWLFENKQGEPENIQKESMAKLEKEIEEAKTFDDLIRALTEADKEVKRYGYGVSIRGSQKLYSAEGLIDSINAVKKAAEAGKDQEVLLHLRFITKAMGFKAATKRIAEDVIDSKRRADELPDMIGENPFKG